MSKVYFMTVERLQEVATSNRYLILTRLDGFRLAVNSKVIGLALKKNSKAAKEQTQFTSFEQCSLMEYITRKRPFMAS